MTILLQEMMANQIIAQVSNFGYGTEVIFCLSGSGDLIVRYSVLVTILSNMNVFLCIVLKASLKEQSGWFGEWIIVL